jgi:phosphoserine phosphatase
MGVGLALAPVRLRGATARAVRAETKVSGRRSLADSRGREPLRRVPAARVSARVGLAARRRASVVPAASKKTLDAVTYAFAEDGTAAVLDAPVGASGDSTVTSSGSSDTERDAAASPLAASSGAAPAAPASPAPDLERLTFEPSRVADLREASSAAAAATSGPAQGQTDESAMAAFTSDDMLCMLYGVDQDKEDAKYKVAFFDLDAVVAAEALRDAAAAVRAHVAGGASEFEFDASRLSERSGALAGRDVDSFAFAAARPGWLPGWLWRPVAALVAFLAQTFANREALSESGKHAPNVSFAEETGDQKMTSPLSFGAFAGARADAASAAALARGVYEAHLQKGVFPEAVRFAKQLRYDGYKVVLVTSAPAFFCEPVANEMGAAKVLGETLLVDEASGTFIIGETQERETDPTYSVTDRIKAFAEEKGVSLSKSIAYGSRGRYGMALMECVGKAYAVSPDAFIQTEAEKRGWQTLLWAEDAARRVERERAAAAQTFQTGDAYGGGAPALAFAGAVSAPKNAASAAWTMRDPDQYDPENDRRSR